MVMGLSDISSKDGSTILEILVKNNHIRCLSLLNQPVFDIIKLFTCAEVEYDNVISCIDHINGEISYLLFPLT